MTKLLKDQAQYDQAVKILEALGYTASMFSLRTRAMDIITCIEDLQQPDGDEITLNDIKEVWDDSVWDDFEFELHKAWALIEGH